MVKRINKATGSNGHRGEHRPTPEIIKLAADLRQNIVGEVRFNAASRALYATDGSNYRQAPLGVVIPKSTEDVVNAVAVCRHHRVPILGRGGGTSLAGQCCNVAVVIDFSKYLDRVLEIDLERRLAGVQPGVVLDELRAATKPHGLTFGPDPATHDHCTLGGMLGNNSCGVHSVQSEFYGPGPRTEHNTAELEVLTYDGLRLRVGQTGPEELERIISLGGRRGEIYGSLRTLRDHYADLIRGRFPDIPRRVSGYNLPALLPENGFDVAAALAGSECTCAITLEATLRLIPALPERVLLVIGYPSIAEAGDHAPALRAFRPVGLEGADDRLVEFMKRKHLHTHDADALPNGKGWLFVEFGADSKEEARERAEEALRSLKGERGIHPKLVFDPAEQAKLWEVRESGLGATAFVPGERDTWEGWEDSAVPVERVGQYLRDLRELLDRYGYDCALYGHFGQGCIHTRIDFDLTSEAGIERYTAFTEEAAHLVVGHGGALSGEHGDGQARADLLHIMFGRELMEAFRWFKEIWDPEGMMNPGKVIDAHRRTDDLRLGADYHPWEPKTEFLYAEDGGTFSHAGLRCVGVGKCRRPSGGTMCPSYMVTREEMHSTRGRAHLLFEMMKGDIIVDRWKSEEVKEALDLCLSCKGCKSDCPVNVDIATYKAEFLSHYFKGRLRPRQAYAFGLIYFWARIASRVPWLANFITQTPGLRELAKAIAGMAPEREFPRFAPRTFRKLFRRRGLGRTDGRPVLLWPDTFNNYFYPDTLMSTVEVLEAAGYRVLLPRRKLCCGRPLYDYGWIDRGRKLWHRTLRVLADEIQQGIPIVGVEPSCVAAFRDELPNLMQGDEVKRLVENTFTVGELLSQHGNGWQPPRIDRPALVHGHCHHKAVLSFQADQEMLQRSGVQMKVLDSGCCGMAGAFGFEKGEKYEVAIAAGERVLLPAVRAADEQTLIIADGFSCREQIRQTTGRRALTLPEVLHLALPRPVEEEAEERAVPPLRPAPARRP